MAVFASVAGWRPGRATWVAGGLVVVLATLLVTAGLTSLAWGSTLRDEGRLLPGTTVAGVEVGDKTLEEALAAVEGHLEPRLDREVTLVHGEDEWTTTARELGGTSDADAIIDEAFERTAEAGLTDLTRMRWAGAAFGPDLDVHLGIDDAQVADFVAAIAEAVDRDPRDAAVSWGEDGIEVAAGRDERRVDTDAAGAALLAGLNGEDETVEVPTDVTEPAITTAAAEDAVATLEPLVTAALDHTVTVAHEGDTWSTSPRELAATPELAEAFDQALAGDGPDRVAVAVPDEQLSGFVASIASDVNVAPRNAEIALDGDGFDITPERDGLALDRDQATADLRRALQGEDDEVGLTVEPARARVTTSSFDRVLLLRQDERTLELFEDLEPTHEWPVAVGQGGSPTPTGTFTVGAKRFEPTWVNPSPNGWGSDMPARIGPGPENPLGVRALNWNDEHGRDTLIRFHGTPNEDSIGEAASQGCVRMFNKDVTQLYDLVPSGTVVLSVD
jgi:vancomycin resistance protein YoaR